ALISIGIFLRVAGLTWGIPDRENQSSVYHDEGHVLGSVLMSWGDFKKEFGEYEIVRPVFFWRLLGRPLISIGTSMGINDESTRVFELSVLRSITSFVAILGLIGVYYLGRKLGKESTGLWALSFFVFMPGHWYYSQILKGDVMVATFFVLILLFAIRIAERGDRFAYVGAGILFGVGVAIKATTIIAAPVLLLAHILFAWKEKRWQVLVSKNTWIILLATGISFLALYPYPFIDFARLKGLLAHPTTQSFIPVLLVSPQTYIDVWREYNLPLKPFGEMIYGKFLLWTAIPSFLVIFTVACVEFVRKRRTDLLLVVSMFLIFAHSLTFTAVLDERYLLPSAPFVAIFFALVITGTNIFHLRWFSVASALFGSAILAGTVAITWITFPLFALDSPREQAITWVRENALPGSIIAQPSQLSRWALRFNRDIYKVTNFVYGEEGDRHIARLTDADIVVVQQDPWNWDHSFRYELENLGDELVPFLEQYTNVKVFGKVPKLFGLRIPQNLGTPVLAVYSGRTFSVSEKSSQLRATTLPIKDGVILPLFKTRACSEPLKTFTPIRLRPHLTVPGKIEGSIYIGVALHESPTEPLIPIKAISEPSVESVGTGYALYIPMSIQKLYDKQEFTIVLDYADCNHVAFYTNVDGMLRHVGHTPRIPAQMNVNLFIISPDMKTAIGNLEVL
ncbi:MAG: glycosyltransferase family 39 protein, partial [Patescibacteria group bacterium]